MENGPFEDVFPIENGDFPLPCYSLLEDMWYLKLDYLFSHMELENYLKWKETHTEGTHFKLPWLREEE